MRHHHQRRIAGLIVLWLFLVPQWAAVGQTAPPPGGESQRVELVGQVGGLVDGALPLGDGTILAAEGPALLRLAISRDSTQVLARRNLNHGPIIDLVLCADAICALTVEGVVTLTGSGPDGLPTAGAFAPGGGQAMAAQGDLVAVAARQAGVRLLRVSAGGGIASEITLPVGAQALDVALDRASQRAYVAEGDAGIAVIALGDPPVALGTIASVTPADAVAVAGRLLAVGSGGRVLLLDPATGGQPPVGTYAPLTGGHRIVIDQDYAYVADTHDGLKILWLTAPDRPIQVYGEADRPATGVAVDTDTAYIIGPDGLRILDVSSKYRPLQIGALALPGQPKGITLGAGRAFVALGDPGVAVVDVSNLSAPRLERLIPVGGSANAVALDGGTLYAAAGDAGLAVIDASVPGGETLQTTLTLPGPALDLAVRDIAVYVVTGETGLVSVDIERPTTPAIAAVLTPPAGQSDLTITISGKRAYIGQGDAFIIADVSHPKSLGVLGRVEAPAEDMAASDIYLYALGSDQLAIYNAQATAEPIYLRAYRGLKQIGRITLDGMQAFVTSAGDGPDIAALDFSAPDLPAETDNVGEMGHTGHVATSGRLVLLPAGLAGLRLYSLTEGGALIPEGSYGSLPEAAHLATDGTRLLVGGEMGWAVTDSGLTQALGTLVDVPVRGLAVDGDTAAVAAGDAGVALYSLAGDKPSLVAHRETSGPATAVALDPGFVYVADSAGLEIYNRRNLSPTQRIELSSPALGVALGGRIAYLPLADGSLAAIDLGDPAGGIKLLGSAPTARPTTLIPAPDGLIYGLADTQVSRLALGDLNNPAAIGVGTLPQVGERGFFINDLLAVLAPGEALRLYDPKTVPAGATSYAEITTGALDITADWPLAYVAYGEGGLGALSLPDHQASPPFYTEPVYGLHRDGDTLYAAGSALTAWDVSQRDHPALLATLPLDFSARHIDPEPGGNLLVSTQTGLIIARRDGGGLTQLGSLTTPDSVDRAVQIGGRGYLALHNGGLLVADLSDPSHPSSLFTYTSASGQFVHDLLKLDETHLLVAWEGGVDVLDVSAPAAAPHLANTIPVGAAAGEISLAPDGKLAALALGNQGVALVDLSSPQQPAVAGRVETPGDGIAARLEGKTLYVADGRCGLRIFDTADAAAPHEMGYWRGDYVSDVLAVPDASGQETLIAAGGSQIARLRYNPAGPTVPPPAPQNPQPPMDDSSAPITLALQWGPPADPCAPLTYAVYFGQEDHPPLLGTVSRHPRIEVPPLSPLAEYYWRVEAVDAQGDRISGPVWRFTTAGAEYPNAFPPSPPPFLAWIEEHPTIGLGLILLFLGIPLGLFVRGAARRSAAVLPRGEARRKDIPDWYSSGSEDVDEGDQQGPGTTH